MMADSTVTSNISLGFLLGAVDLFLNEMNSVYECFRSCDSWVLKLEKVLTNAALLMGVTKPAQVVYIYVRRVLSYFCANVLQIQFDQHPNLERMIEIGLSYFGQRKLADLWDVIREMSLCLRMNNCQNDSLADLNAIKFWVCNVEPPEEDKWYPVSTCEQLFNDGPLILAALGVTILFIWAWYTPTDDGGGPGSGGQQGSGLPRPADRPNPNPTSQPTPRSTGPSDPSKPTGQPAPKPTGQPAPKLAGQSGPKPTSDPSKSSGDGPSKPPGQPDPKSTGQSDPSKPTGQSDPSKPSGNDPSKPTSQPVPKSTGQSDPNPTSESDPSKPSGDGTSKPTGQSDPKPTGQSDPSEPSGNGPSKPSSKQSDPSKPSSKSSPDPNTQTMDTICPICKRLLQIRIPRPLKVYCCDGCAPKKDNNNISKESTDKMISHEVGKLMEGVWQLLCAECRKKVEQGGKSTPWKRCPECDHSHSP